MDTAIMESVVLVFTCFGIMTCLILHTITIDCPFNT